MQQTAADKVQGLLQEQNQLLVQQARLQSQLKAIETRLAVIDAAVEGVNLGSALAAEVAAEKADTEAA